METLLLAAQRQSNHLPGQSIYLVYCTLAFPEFLNQRNSAIESDFSRLSLEAPTSLRYSLRPQTLAPQQIT
jgi:hypothetical protein